MPASSCPGESGEPRSNTPRAADGLRVERRGLSTDSGDERGDNVCTREATVRVGTTTTAERRPSTPVDSPVDMWIPLVHRMGTTENHPPEGCGTPLIPTVIHRFWGQRRGKHQIPGENLVFHSPRLWMDFSAPHALVFVHSGDPHPAHTPLVRRDLGIRQFSPGSTPPMTTTNIYSPREVRPAYPHPNALRRGPDRIDSPSRSAPPRRRRRLLGPADDLS